MNLLLDTHIFLWHISDDKRLPVQWSAAIRNPKNNIYLSVVCHWEIAVKYQLGKLPLPDDPATYIPEQRKKHQFSTLPLDEDMVTQLKKLPLIHRDPFDRMLICQALGRNMTLITVDGDIRKYNVPIFSIPKD